MAFVYLEQACWHFPNLLKEPNALKASMPRTHSSSEDKG